MPNTLGPKKRFVSQEARAGPETVLPRNCPGPRRQSRASGFRVEDCGCIVLGVGEVAHEHSFGWIAGPSGGGSDFRYALATPKLALSPLVPEFLTPLNPKV